MGAITSQITSLTIVYSTVDSGADQRKHQSSASLDFVRGIHRWPMNSLHKGPVTRKMFPFDDVIMNRIHISWGVVFTSSNVCRVFDKVLQLRFLFFNLFSDNEYVNIDPWFTSLHAVVDSCRSDCLLFFLGGWSNTEVNGYNSLISNNCRPKLSAYPWWRHQIYQSPVDSHKKASDAELWCFLWSAPEQTVEQRR